MEMSRSIDTDTDTPIVHDDGTAIKNEHYNIIMCTVPWLVLLTWKLSFFN